MIKSCILNNKKIYAFLSKEQFLDFVQNRSDILIALNAEKLNKANENLDKIINSNIGYPDGIGAVLALKRKGIRSTKIPGAEFWLDIISKYKHNKSFYFIGASPKVMEKTIKKLQQDFPKINIKGFRNGYFDDSEKPNILADVIMKQPDVVFVAMGSPKQEFFMDYLLTSHKALYMGLGGSFDVYSGTKKRAPKIFIKLGLEWFYRLLKEPTRISRQLNLIKFFFKIIFGKI